MIGVHVEFKLKPEGVDHFLKWKQLEGEIQRKTPGFIKRSMSRSIEDPALFWYVSYWRSKEEMHAFAESGAFRQAGKQSGLTADDHEVERKLVYITECFDEQGEFPEGS